MTPFRPHAEGVTVAVRLTPGVRAEGIHGVADAGEGAVSLKVSVTAVPEDGKANKALIALLSKTWRLPKSALSLISGDTHRNKVVLVAGETGAVLARLSAWLAEKG